MTSQVVFAAISYIGSASASGATIDLSTISWQANDIVLVFAFRDGSDTPPSTATGFTSINTGYANGTGTDCSARLAYRILQIGDGSLTFTFTNATEYEVIILRGTNTSSPVAQSAAWNDDYDNTMTYSGLANATFSTSWITGFGGHINATDVNSRTVPGMTIRSSSTINSLGMHSMTGATSFTQRDWQDVNTSHRYVTIVAEVLEGVPTLTVNPTSLNFGNNCINTVVGPLNFTINGTNLTTANVTVASLTGFTYSTDDINYYSSLSLSQSGGSFIQVIYVKFSPTLVQSYSGNITVGGGGAANVNEVVIGSGVTGTATQLFNTPGSYTLIIPSGINSITVECWGGGGGGGGAHAWNGHYGGGGGGGGAYNSSIMTISPGQSYSIIVGGGGSGGGDGTNGSSGDPSSVSGPGGSISANGGNFGNGGYNSNGAGGAGGTGSYNGGTGGTSTGNGAGGGGGAGNSGNGGAGGNAVTGTGGSGNPDVAPYRGGYGGAYIDYNAAGNPGNNPGGGGGGGRAAADFWSSSYNNGGPGASGQVIISWPCSTCTNGTLTLTSGNNAQTICNNTVITNITYTVGGGATGATVTGLPTGLSGNFVSPTYTISGTAIQTGTFNYSVTTTGTPSPCTEGTATGTITVNVLPTFTTNYNDITCFGAGDGQITITVTSGPSPYYFSIYNGLPYTPGTYPSPYTFTVLSPGTYKVRVKDANGCESPVCP